MTRRAVLALAAVLFVLVAACGDDDDLGRVEDPTSIVATVGPPATLPRGLLSVTPVHAAETTAADLQQVCVTLDLLAGEGIADFSDVTVLTLNLEDVSDSLEWTNTDDEPTSEATGCYVPPSPLDPAVYAATLRYTDTTERTFIYNWQFTVTG